jgi:hypothetical protein
VVEILDHISSAWAIVLGLIAPSSVRTPQSFRIPVMLVRLVDADDTYCAQRGPSTCLPNRVSLDGGDWLDDIVENGELKR